MRQADILVGGGERVNVVRSLPLLPPARPVSHRDVPRGEETVTVVTSRPSRLHSAPQRTRINNARERMELFVSSSCTTQWIKCSLTRHVSISK